MGNFAWFYRRCIKKPWTKFCFASRKFSVILLGTLFLLINYVLIKDVYLQTPKTKRWTDFITLNESVSSILSKWNNRTRQHIGFFLNGIVQSTKRFGNSARLDSVREIHQHLFFADYFSNYSDETLQKYLHFQSSSRQFPEIFKSWINSRPADSKFSIDFTLNHPQSCVDRGSNLSLLVAVDSTASHAQYRTAIRETWGGFAKRRGAVLLFFIGIPFNAKYHSRIASEDIKFHDVIQGNFLDTYKNLSYKSLSILKWTFEFCPKVKHVLKVDDDMFINMEKFLELAGTRNLSKSIVGELAHQWLPVRHNKNKWYVSYKQYPFRIFPDFVFGPSYLITGDSIENLYETSHHINLFHLEDVYVTGFLAEMSNITRRDQMGMFNVAKDLQPCNYKKIFSSHGHTPPDIYRHWMWLQRRNFQCNQ